MNESSLPCLVRLGFLELNHQLGAVRIDILYAETDKFRSPEGSKVANEEKCFVSEINTLGSQSLTGGSQIRQTNRNSLFLAYPLISLDPFHHVFHLRPFGRVGMPFLSVSPGDSRQPPP